MTDTILQIQNSREMNHLTITKLTIRSMFSKNCIYIFLLMFICSCKKGDEKIYPAEPSIELISVTPTSLVEGEENIIISFKYTDGDGDLGENNSSVKNLFVTDNRLGITYSFRIMQLSPDNSIIPITGTLNADIGTVFVTDSSVQQTVNFSFYIVDRAGHQSNTLTTPAITVNAQ